MQVDVVNIVPGPEKKYLRVATIANKKTDLTYFYIGSDTSAITYIAGNFENGFVAENFEAARNVIASDSFNNQIDVVFIDIPYDLNGLKDFNSLLKVSGVHYTTPILYLEKHFTNCTECGQDNIVDDIIDLNNWQYDFFKKISFIKKAKEYSLSGVSVKSNTRAANNFIKRTFDIAAAISIILLSLPLFLIIMVAIKLESKGPVFYYSKRAGRGFRIFEFYKFRTMEVNADKKIADLAHLNQYNGNESGARFFKISNDPRITKVGKLLRNTSLDELPQLINVLKGDMSLVGNRPLPLYEASTLTTNEFVERFMAPAGITGLWQIKKRGKSDMSAEERISLDISYARKSNLLYDLWIMANTPKALIQKSDV